MQQPKPAKGRLPMLLILCLLAVMLFILANSLLDYDASHAASDFIANLLGDSQMQPDDTFYILVRKIAHLIEYAALGVGVMGLVRFLQAKYHKALFGYGLFGVLMIAVLDEFMQGFSGRTSSVTDVLLDFAGSLLGFLAVFLASLLAKKIKSQKSANTP